MTKERRVVVLMTPEPLRNRKYGTFASRIPELGLTAYGDTLDEALRKVKRMFAAAVQAHRECGNLQAWLVRSGLKWYWEDDYEGPIPAEDAKMSGNPISSRITTAQPEVSMWSNMAGEALPLAA